MAKLNLKHPLPSTETRPVDIARSYIDAGIAVFPCREQASEEFDPSTGEVMDRAEKAPYTTNGLKGATTSRRIIDIWFGERHPNAVIGIPTGEKLGGWVLDLDRHGDRDGHTWLAEMEEGHGPLPDTARATTANGGTHIFFKHIPGVRNRAAIADGVDTRGDGGYIVGPGSVMADGRRYQWVDWDGDGIPEFADAPAWLVDMVITKTPAPAETKPREYVYQPESNDGKERYAAKAFTMELEQLASLTKGQRGQQLFASACRVGELVAGGWISRSEAEAGLLDSAISNGLVATDGERACRDKIKRGLDKTANSPRQIPDREYDNDNTVVNHEAIKRMTQNGLNKNAAAVVDGDAITEAAQDEQAAAPQPKKRERFDLTWFDEIEEGKPKETILKGWLGVGEFTTISGLPGTGKSVVTTDLACHIAAGLDWHGQKVRQGLVVYVAAERKKLTERRMMAFRKHHGVKDVPLLVVGGMLDFTRDTKDADDIIAVIREAETITGHKCVWVIVDTLTRVFGGGDQNSAKDMVKFVRSCDHILTETGAHVTAIHHSAWSGERGKGAIDLDGAVDASFMVKKDGNKHRLVCDGTNDGEEGDVLAFTMQSIQIGVDEEGNPTTAPVVVPVADVKLTSGTLKGYKGDVLKALNTAVEKYGIEPEGDAFPDDVLVVDEQTWRTAFYASRDTTDAGAAETARKQFQRAPKDLIEGGHVHRVGIWYWPA